MTQTIVKIKDNTVSIYADRGHGKASWCYDVHVVKRRVEDVIASDIEALREADEDDKYADTYAAAILRIATLARGGYIWTIESDVYDFDATGAETWTKYHGTKSAAMDCARSMNC